jgi:hypothetical protein
MRAGVKDSAITIDGDTTDWRGRTALYTAPSSRSAPAAPLHLKSFRVTQDEAYVYLRLDVSKIDWSHGHYQVGIDSYRRDLGDLRLPHTGSPSPVGLEFILDIAGPGETQVLVDAPYNPYRPVHIPGSSPAAIQYVYNHAARSVANSAGAYDSVVAVPNRRRISRDGRIYPAVSYNRNRLLYARQQDNSLTDWFANEATGVIEVRIPWGMLQVLDPSSHSVLNGIAATSEAIPARTDGFRFIVESYDPSKAGSHGEHFPQSTDSSRFGNPQTWTWPSWEAPRWRAETKPVFAAMQRTFANIPEHPTR